MCVCLGGCVGVCHCECMKQINYFPGGFLFEYVIFQHILLEGYDLFVLRAFICCSVLSN